MNRRILAFLLAGAAAGLLLVAALVLRHPPSLPIAAPLPPPSPGRSERPSPRAEGTRKQASISEGQILDRALLALQRGRPQERIAFAAELRASARAEEAVLRKLRTLVLDESAAPGLRELAACVLGSLSDRESQECLSQALSKAIRPEWIRVLLLALGSEKEWDDDDAFSMAGQPRVVETALGLHLLIKGPLEEGALRVQLRGFLSPASPLEVRDAAARALYDSLRFEDVRTEYLVSLRSEPEPELRGMLGRGLAEWAAPEPGDSAERRNVFAAILEQGVREDGSALRFNTEPGLKSMKLTASEVQALSSLLRAEDPDQRRWSLSILGDQAARSGLPQRAEVFATVAMTLANDADAKTREYAAGALGSFPDNPGAATALRAALKDPAWHVRAGAANALQRLPIDEVSLSELRRIAAQDENESVRKTAEEALKRLTRK